MRSAWLDRGGSVGVDVALEGSSTVGIGCICVGRGTWFRLRIRSG
jgi:hypothetical protein